MVGILLLTCAIAVTIRAALKHRSLALGVFASTLFVFYGIRALGLAFHWDDPYPRHLFSATDIDSQLTSFGALVLVFCLSVIFAHSVLEVPAKTLTKALPFSKEGIQRSTMMTAMVAVTIVAVALALHHVMSHGGLAGAIYAAKSAREGGDAVQRIPATMAVVLSCVCFASAGRAGSEHKSGALGRVLAACCVAAAVFSASVWGSRQFVVLAAAYLLGATTMVAFRDSRRSWWIRAGLVGALVVGIGFGLRLYRDEVLGGETAVTQAAGDDFRQISIAANGTSLDSSLLAVRDWPRVHEWRGGDDFVTGLWSAVPQSWRPEGLRVDTVGAEFHRVYDPAAANGWPIGAPTEWYINFGWWGVLLGGLLTGLVYRSITIGFRSSSMPELAAMATLLLTLIVFPLGVGSASPNRFVVHAFPLTLLLVLLRLPHELNRQSPSTAERAAETVDAKFPTRPRSIP